MKILGYRGTSLVSRAIKLQTRSKYSHIGIMFDDNSVVEAWAEGFFAGKVRRIETPFTKHANDTLIDVYHLHPEFAAPFFNEAVANAWLEPQIGKDYDYSSVFRFMSRRRAADNDKVFCSELGETYTIKGGVRLLNGNPSEHSPRDTLLSTLLIKEETIWKDK